MSGPPGARRKKAAAKDPLAALEVIDRLDVGPVRLEKRRLVCPYQVTRVSGGQDRIDLIYRYGEDVFDPDEYASRNLAAMIAAQVALNYGLFCRRIVFHGEFDRYDRRFLDEYAGHTAREIYVNKFLLPNPFLQGPAAELEAYRAPTYLRAHLEFREPRSRGARPRPAPPGWVVDESRHLVLSSGGKDSLLSLGLLQELQREVHPVFVNESGRHWFTALSAYRRLRDEIEETTRVWTNSDRVFAWMLRQLPFVRRDFARVRSDEYPIRLWTVAVFSFGALPLMRRRGVARLVIGDEHDTTTRATFRGITHYAGLYDQSRWFDNAMSRYFHRKGWQVQQFSLLRWMSELLILKTLVDRYPDLQTLQVSCHATHVESDRVRPCGRCEKCRRVVAMLLALDADPSRCGYRPEHARSCLDALVEQGIHQESAGVEHLFHVLRQKGLIPDSIPTRPRPEVMQLRVDSERSPLDTIPGDLRRELFAVLAQHAQGCVERKGRDWLPCDPLEAEALARPYPFEHESAGHGPVENGEGTRPGAVESCDLGEMTWEEAQRRLREVDVALLPVGSIEQHGPHLPLDTDAYDARRLAEDVARACTSPRPLVLPLVSYGVSYHHDDFPGTISIGPDTLSTMIYEIGMSLAKSGVTKLLIINGHGGNSPALHFAAQMINRDARIFTCVDTGETSDADVDALAETPNDVHAGEIETSTTLALRPHLVRMGKAARHVPRFSSEYLDFTSRRSVGWYARTSRISPTGVMGDPTKASREKGERMWGVMVRNLVELVEDIKGLTLDEIHQRRY